MSCPGLHCPGCSGGQSLGIAAATVLGLVLLDQTMQWVAEHIWWIGGTLAACFALAVAAGMWLEQWADARGARFAAAHGILSRADVVAPEVVRAVVVEAVPERSPIAPAPQVVVNIFGIPSPEQAAIIRRALPGQAGDAITEGK